MKRVCLLFRANWAWFVHFYPKFVDNLIIYIIQMLVFVFLHFRFSKIAKMYLYSPSFFRLIKTYLIFISSLFFRFSFNRYQKSFWAWKKFVVFWFFECTSLNLANLSMTLFYMRSFFQISAIRNIAAGIFQYLILLFWKLHSNGFFKTTVSI